MHEQVQYVKFYIPGIDLGKNKTNICNVYMVISLLTPVSDEIINEALELFQDKGNPSVHEDEEVDVSNQSEVGGNGTDQSDLDLLDL